MFPSTTALPLPPNFFEIWARTFSWMVLGRALGHPVDVTDDRADEGDAHHAQLELGGRRVLLGDAERVDDEEADPLVPDGLAGVLRQLAPHLLRREVGLQDERATLDQALERVGVDERLVVGRHDDLDVLELGVGEQHRLGAQRDVVVGGCAALLRAVLGGRLGVHAEDAGQDVGEQLAGGDGAVPADRVEADPHRRGRQEHRVGLGLQRHQLGLRVGRAQPRLDLREAAPGVFEKNCEPR